MTNHGEAQDCHLPPGWLGVGKVVELLPVPGMFWRSHLNSLSFTPRSAAPNFSPKPQTFSIGKGPSTDDVTFNRNRHSPESTFPISPRISMRRPRRFTRSLICLQSSLSVQGVTSFRERPLMSASSETPRTLFTLSDSWRGAARGVAWRGVAWRGEALRGRVSYVWMVSALRAALRCPAPRPSAGCWRGCGVEGEGARAGGTPYDTSTATSPRGAGRRAEGGGCRGRGEGRASEVKQCRSPANSPAAPPAAVDRGRRADAVRAEASLDTTFWARGTRECSGNK